MVAILLCRTPTIFIAAAMITRADGRALLVRKRGTSAFMQAGGKLEPAEAAADALCRELSEELGLRVDPSEPVHLGRFSAPAANEPGCTVVAEVFHLQIETPIQAAAEIEEITWVDPQEAVALPLAPLTRDHLLPLWISRSPAASTPPPHPAPDR